MTDSWNRDVSRQLNEVKNGTREKVEFTKALNSEERKYIHKLCSQLALKSKSTGKGDNRFLTVSRKGDPGVQNGKGGAGAADGSAIIPVCLPEHLLEELQAAPPCPEQWDLTAPAQREGKAHDGYVRRAQPSHLQAQPTTSNLEAAEKARRAQKPGYAAMQASRRQLPAWAQVDEILTALRKHRVVLIAGETGCGKSTQVPQYLLDAMPTAQLVVTQPRRIAATSLAERVAQERCEKAGASIGYAIHMERKTSPQTRCLYCTTGVFRRRLLADPRLEGLTHVVVDEVHERELHADFVLMVLKQVMEDRKDLRLVLMSATLQLDVFQRFFPGSVTVQIPGRTFPVKRLYLEDIVMKLHKSPKLRPMLGPAFAAAGHADEKEFKKQVNVQERHPDQVCGYGGFLSQAMTPQRLADGCAKHDMLQQFKGTIFDIPIIDALISYLETQQDEEACNKGAILCFFPGWSDIDRTKRRLESSLSSSRFKVLKCHSQVRAEEQRRIFQRPPAGMRKIILASNIAETSITVEDVSIVIDTGRAKETDYDPYLKVGTLATTFVSQASVAQRAGRAGRTQNGVCFHLFSRKRYEKMEKFRAPELLRSPLEDVCLHTAHLLMQRGAASAWDEPGDMAIQRWLAAAPQPPEPVATRNAVALLRSLGALTPTGEISTLGVKFSHLPLPVTLARSLVWGILFGCLDHTLILLGASSGRDPFQLPQGTGQAASGGGSSFSALSRLLKQKKKELATPTESDHIALLKAVFLYEERRSMLGADGARQFCEEYCLNFQTVAHIIEFREKMKQELRQQKLLRNDLLDFANRNLQSMPVFLAVLAAGVFPNLAVRRPGKKRIEVNGGALSASTHPQSLVENCHSERPPKQRQDSGLPPTGTAEWVCYNQVTQVEESYSIQGVSHVCPLTLMLLCGDDPMEVHVEGSDALVSLLDGWVQFAMPQDQAFSVQDLRYALRQAFVSYCDSPTSLDEHLDTLNAAVALLQGSTEADGRPARLDEGYKPRLSKKSSLASVSSLAGSKKSVSKASLGPAEGGSKAPPARRQSRGVVPPLKPGAELEGMHQLVQDVYMLDHSKKPPLDCQFEEGEGGTFRATYTITVDGFSATGEWVRGKKPAQRSAARVIWEELASWCNGEEGGAEGELEGGAAECDAAGGEEEEVEEEEEGYDGGAGGYPAYIDINAVGAAPPPGEVLRVEDSEEEEVDAEAAPLEEVEEEEDVAVDAEAAPLEEVVDDLEEACGGGEAWNDTVADEGGEDASAALRFLQGNLDYLDDCVAEGGEEEEGYQPGSEEQELELAAGERQRVSVAGLPLPPPKRRRVY